MEREVGGVIGMGNTCKPMAVSFQCMTKFTRNKKKIKKKMKKTLFSNFKTDFILTSFLWSLKNIMAIQCQKRLLFFFVVIVL